MESRVEKILNAMITGDDSKVEEPQSRIEVLLIELMNKDAKDFGELKDTLGNMVGTVKFSITDKGLIRVEEVQ